MRTPIPQMDETDKISWEWGNEVLYRMCREEPGHTDRNKVAAKLWLIGRAYAAQIERRAGATGDSEVLYARVATKIVESDIDKWLEDVSHINRPDISNLRQILSAHYNLTSLLQSVTKFYRRSLASKYLHFHQPLAFFIFDSRASTKIREKIGHRHIPLPAYSADQEYAAFVLRCMTYRDEKPAAEHNLTPRHLDQELLGY